MTSGKIAKRNWTRFHFLIISLCIHMVIFILMGSIVFHNMQEPRESVSVQLLKAMQPERRLRRNIPEPRNWVVVQTNSPKKSHDIAEPMVRQENASSYSATEVIPVVLYEPVEAKGPQVFSQILHRNHSLAAPKIDVSKPVASITMPQEGLLKMYESPSDLPPSPRPSPPDRQASDSKILKEFLRMISGKIEKSKRYPGWAMDAGLEGKVIVRFTILRDGKLSEHPRLVRSSGAKILDNAAIAAIRSAAPFPALPDSLSQERLQVELPMDFRLRESGSG